MHVQDVMTRNVYAFAPDTSLDTAARILAGQHIGGAPVVEPSGRPVGVITMLDLVDPDRPKGGRDGYPLYYRMSPTETDEIGDDVHVGDGRVGDVMSPFVLAIEASAGLDEAAERMLEDGVHRLLVMDRTKLIGIVTSMDLLRGFLREGR